LNQVYMCVVRVQTCCLRCLFLKIEDVVRIELLFLGSETRIRRLHCEEAAHCLCALCTCRMHLHPPIVAPFLCFFRIWRYNANRSQHSTVPYQARNCIWSRKKNDDFRESIPTGLNPIFIPKLLQNRMT
jgi:hypothetical protein